MKVLNIRNVQSRLTFLAAVFLVGFAILGVAFWASLGAVKVEGPYYEKIVASKDLIADVLPPPEYLVESYLITLQLKDETQPELRKGMMAKLGALHREYDKRHQFWQSHLADGALRGALLDRSDRAARRFFAVLEGEYLPAIARGDRATAQKLADGKLKSAYAEHRRAIDEVVNLATARYERDESEAGAIVRRTAILLPMMFLGLVGASAFLISRTARRIVADVTMQTERLDRTQTNLGGVVERLRGVAERVKGDAERVAHTGGEVEGEMANATRVTRAASESMLQITTAVERVAELSAHLDRSCQAQESGTAEAIGAMEQLRAAVALVHEGNLRQQEAVNDVDREMESASCAVGEMTGSADRFSLAASRAADVAAESGRSVSVAIESMRRIQEQMTAFSEKVGDLGGKSVEIGGILATIQQIAKQTNLLALNATIEAARAGVHGQGFAVVAEEVRRLAVQVSDATREIGGLIEGVRSGVSETIAAMEVSQAEVARGAARGEEAERSLEQILEATDSVRTEVDFVSETARRLEGSVSNTRNAVGGMLMHIVSGAEGIERMSVEAETVSVALTQVRESALQTSGDAGKLVDVAQSVVGSSQEVRRAVEAQEKNIVAVDTSARALSTMADGLRLLSSTLEDEVRVHLQAA